MKFQKAKLLIGGTMLAVILSSCNIGATPVPTQDISAIQTQAFGQVLTQVAAANTPTPLPTYTPSPTAALAGPATFAPIGGSNGTVTPFAFNTPLPGLTPLVLLSPMPTLAAGMMPTKNGCNDGQLIGESAPYDGDVLRPSKPFEKNFDLINTGSCAWDEGYVFVFQPQFSTPGFKGGDILIRKAENYTAPGKKITFTLKLMADVQSGEHAGYWKMRDDGGNYFGPLVWVKYYIGTRDEQAATAEAKALTATAEAK